MAKKNTPGQEPIEEQTIAPAKATTNEAAAYEEKIAALETANSALQKALEEATADGVVTAEEKAKIAALEKVVEQQNAALHKQAAELESLKKKQAAADKKEAPEAPKKATIPTEPFEVGGKKYLLNAARFNIKLGGGRRSITAVEAYQDEALLQEIVENWPTLVTEVN